MKSLLTACCFFFLLYNSSKAGEYPELIKYDQANAIFGQKKYSEAAAMFQQLIDEGYNHPELYINAGNAWYKANRTGLAIYNYEKALILDPFNKAALHNRSVANQRVEGYVNDLPLLFFQRWWLQLQHFYSPNGWAIGSIVFFWFLIAVVISILLKPSLKPALLKWGAVTSGILFLCFISLAVSAYVSVNTHDTGIIMGNVVKVKAGPDQGSKDVFELHEGTKVQVTDATQEYCKIMLPDGKTGWLTCAEIKRL
ncbi:Tetratricopeptide repeat-containing protein [Chitinophaga sp. CF118]|uniref:SH3 domain-containing protein n=1 Tax=Chitinophaga sp. CF118 TaxID=1884367 RepID=UPI0008E1E1B4|nr:SH3 domain-containing protein [Chitinophaga sp. CF118]SFD33243.1 Tetratricopeptide repeat-containing protein [Chitinophaga sp. CF118]